VTKHLIYCRTSEETFKFKLFLFTYCKMMLLLRRTTSVHVAWTANIIVNVWANSMTLLLFPTPNICLLRIKLESISEICKRVALAEWFEFKNNLFKYVHFNEGIVLSSSRVYLFIFLSKYMNNFLRKFTHFNLLI